MKRIINIALLAALCAPAAAAPTSFEVLAGAAASDIKLPAVNVQAAFPGMQTCAFTEAKENTCVFTCKNGAKVVRPAVQSQFIPGGCAKFVMVPSDYQEKSSARAVQNWAEAAKAAYLSELDAGGLTDFANLQELPPGARRQLETELQSLPQGPGNSSEAFKLRAANRTAFVVQSYIHSDSLRAWIFNAAGVLVAYGEGSADSDFAWLPLPY
jgi:hypothetical protein